MADITTCREPGCPWCGSVITFDDSSSHEHLEKVRLMAEELSQYPIRVVLGADPAVVIPSCWEDDTPLRYVTPTTD